MLAMSTDANGQAPNGAHVREIIIVDDNEDWRDCLAGILELEGYAVTGFSDGSSFLAKAADRTPICVFLDVMMPGPSGLEVLEKLADIGYQAPIFLISARADTPVLLEAMRNGALDVIEKPFDPYTAVLHVRQAVDLWLRRASKKPDSALAESRLGVGTRLTREECAMLAQVASGASTKEAARRLGISTKAAAKCRADAKRKFGVKRFAELVRIALNEMARAKHHAAHPSFADVVAAGTPPRPKSSRPPKNETAPASRPRRRTLAGMRGGRS